MVFLFFTQITESAFCRNDCFRKTFHYCHWESVPQIQYITPAGLAVWCLSVQISNQLWNSHVQCLFFLDFWLSWC